MVEVPRRLHIFTHLYMFIQNAFIVHFFTDFLTIRTTAQLAARAKGKIGHEVHKMTHLSVLPA